MPGGSGGGIPDKGCWTGLAFGRFFFGRGLATPASVARRRNYRYTSDTDHASALQRVWSIMRRTGLMRSQGCQTGVGRLFAVHFTWRLFSMIA